MIGFVSTATHAVIPLQFQIDGEVRMVSIPTSVTVSAAATYSCLAVHGLGLIQVPRYGIEHELAAGNLVEVLATFPPTSSPVYLLYPGGRPPSPRLRLFIEWAVTEVGQGLERTTSV